MSTQVNWQWIRSEFQRLADVEKLKSEVQRIGAELRNFDFQGVLSPRAKEKVKAFEKRYGEIMRTIHQAQRQVDREFNRVLRQIKTHRVDMSKVVTQQKDKLEKLSTDFRKRFSKSTRTAKTTTSAAAAMAVNRRRKTTSKKAAGRRRKKA